MVSFLLLTSFLFFFQTVLGHSPFRIIWQNIEPKAEILGTHLPIHLELQIEMSQGLSLAPSLLMKYGSTTCFRRNRIRAKTRSSYLTAFLPAFSFFSLPNP